MMAEEETNDELEPVEDDPEGDPEADGEQQQSTGDAIDALSPEERASWANTVTAAKQANMDGRYVLQLATEGEKAQSAEMHRQHEQEKKPPAAEVPAEGDDEPMTVGDWKKRETALRAELEADRRAETNSQLDGRMLAELGVTELVFRQAHTAVVDSFVATSPSHTREQIWRNAAAQFGWGAKPEKTTEEKLGKAVAVARNRGTGPARGTPADSGKTEKKLTPFDDAFYEQRREPFDVDKQ